MGTKQAAA